MPAEATDYVPQLQRAKAQGAKYVVIQNVSTPAAQLAKNIAEQGLDMKIVCLNWCGDELFVELAGDAPKARRRHAVRAGHAWRPRASPQPRDFLSKSGGSLDKEGLHYVQGWYTMAVMAEGIKRAVRQGRGHRRVDQAGARGDGGLRHRRRLGPRSTSAPSRTPG